MIWSGNIDRHYPKHNRFERTICLLIKFILSLQNPSFCQEKYKGHDINLPLSRPLNSSLENLDFCFHELEFSSTSSKFQFMILYTDSVVSTKVHNFLNGKSETSWSVIRMVHLYLDRGRKPVIKTQNDQYQYSIVSGHCKGIVLQR